MGCWARRESKAGRFSKAQWQAHVLANLPFYSLLLPLFLDLVRCRVSFRCDESLEDLEMVRPCTCLHFISTSWATAGVSGKHSMPSNTFNPVSKRVDCWILCGNDYSSLRNTLDTGSLGKRLIGTWHGNGIQTRVLNSS